MKSLIIPSIIAKNQKELSASLLKMKKITTTLHLDVVDGKFAPNHSLDFPFKLSQQFKYQAHLMIKKPQEWIKKNGKGIDVCIAHISEIENPQEYIMWMKKNKKKVAFALLPQTPVSSLKKYLSDIDYILILTVHPGFYGSKYSPSNLDKISQIKKINTKVKVIVDGGINPQTIQDAVHAGANYFVSGSFVMNAKDPKKAIEDLDREVKKIKNL